MHPVDPPTRSFVPILWKENELKNKQTHVPLPPSNIRKKKIKNVNISMPPEAFQEFRKRKPTSPFPFKSKKK
jgi:hypothetical protein